MLEREDVTGTIARLVRRAERGRGGALFVTAQAGLGKTTVLDHTCKLVAPGARVGLGRGDPMETAVAFGLMTQVVEELGGATLLGEGAEPQFAGAQLPDDLRASKFHRALRSLQTAACESPVLLAFDDVHWADPDSLALLSFLCRRIDALPVALVATLRPWPPAAAETAVALADAGYASVEELRPLSTGAAADLLTDRLGRRPPAEVLTSVYEASAGNPLLIELAALDLTGVADPASAGEQEVAGPHPMARALVLRRLAGLPEPTVAFARAASVLGRTFRPDIATILARLDEQQADLAVESLSRTGLVRHAGVGFAEFTYPLVAQAVYHDLGPLLRDQLHGRAFRVLCERGLEDEATEHAVRGNLSGDVEAVAALARAGEAALRAGAVATAAERLGRAVALAGDKPGSALLTLLGEAFMALGRGDQAAAVYERVLSQAALLPDTAREARRMLGRALFVVGQVAEGERRLEEAASLSEADGPALAVKGLLDLSRAAWLTAGPAGALPVVAQAREAARSADERSRVEAEAAWGFVAFVAGDPAGLEATAAAGRAALPDDGSVLRDLAWNWGTLRNTGRAAKYAERFGEAEAVFVAMFNQAEQSGSPHAIASLAAHHADTLVRQGRLEEALRLAARAVALGELAPMAAAFAHAAEASLLLHAGQPEESEEACERAEQAATACGQWLPLMRVWNVRALRHLGNGRPDLACELYSRLEEETVRLGIAEPCLVHWARRAVLAMMGHGDHAGAERVRSWVEVCSHRLPCRWPRIAAEVSASAVAEARDDHPAAEAHLRAALDLHGEVALPLEHVETLLHWGAYLRRTGRVLDSRAVLRDALALAERSGSVWLAAQVQQELTVARGRRRASRPGHDLTPQEQRVAELAAAGRSGSEIASQLSLSTRTIATHLHRVYAKLGIHSQRELMARMRSGAPEAPPVPGPGVE